MAWELVGRGSLGSTHQLEIWYDVRSQNVGANTSTVAVELGIRRLGSSGKYWNYEANNVGTFQVDGRGVSVPWWSYDFRNYSYLVIGQDTMTISHNADGSKTLYSQASISVGGGLLSNGSASGSKTLPTIPRATQPSVNVSRQDFGKAVTISMPRASGNFTHKLWYRINSGSWVEIANGLGTSYTWTLPLNEMNKIPNATTATVEIWVDTFNGGTNIGYKTTSFTGVVPGNIVPSVSSLTAKEYVADVNNKIGTYVQGKSRITLTAGGGSGTYGSTISSWRISGHGINVNASSGTTSIVSISGSTTYTVTVTDSRGRTATKTISVSILPYSPPKISKFSAIRTNSTGTSVWNGTYVKSMWEVNVASLINGSQKNTLTIYLDHRVNNASGWTNFKTVTNGSTITSNTSSTNGTFDVTKGYEIRIRVVDVFGASNESIAQISSGTVALDIGTDNLGVGKFWERGGLDVKGVIYHDDGKLVENGYLGQLPAGDCSSGDFWRSLDTGMYMRSPSVSNPGAPSDYGHVWVYASGKGSVERTIIWKAKADGNIYHTGTNSNTAKVSWKWVVDNSNYSTIAKDTVVEYGNTSNGQYWKYESGLLICKHVVSSANNAAPTAWGGMYYLYFSTNVWKYPVPFVGELPALSCNPSGGVFACDNNNLDECDGLYQLRPVSSGFRGNKLQITATGRWK